MRVLVTGGAGFIGSHIVDALLARGDAVVVVDDLSTRSRDNLDPRAELVVADIADAAALNIACGAFDAVAHFAAKTKVVESTEKPDLYRRVILDGTANVLALAVRRGASVFVNISSGGAGYGETPVCATEETPQAPAAPYGRLKVEAESLVAGAAGAALIASAAGAALVAGAVLRGVTLRLANVYGPRQRGDLEGGVVAIFQERWRARAPLTVYGDGTMERDYIHVRDVAEATLAAIDRPVAGAFNIGTGVATSVSALIVAMSEVLGPPPGVRHVAERPGEVRRSCLDCSKAARARLWASRTPLADGLRLTVAPTA
ncbi:MAG: NAD-dependent epimerase/dehydratase family protein [Candidatus Limnocylindria bacterium]|nr:NAD-dependent epimerase/dehydratase family protein [Candidatus Limnocylindria bacterium]